MRGLLKSVGQSELRHEAVAIFREIWSAASLRSPHEPPRWSGVTDDSTPFEFSVQFGPSTAVRMLIEPQADPASPASYWRAGTQFTRWLARRWDADIDLAKEIESLFRPRAGARVYLAMGHAVELRKPRPIFKVYYNTMARGSNEARATVARALDRIGFATSWRRIERALRPMDRIELLALDLTDSVRVKLYVRPLQATLHRLTQLYEIAERAEPSDVPRAWAAIHRSNTPERMRPAFLTYQMTGRDSRPSRVSLSIPLFPGLRHDGDASQRIAGLMREFGMSAAAYRRCVSVMTRRPLQDEEGLHSYVALQRTSSEPVIVVYFNPRLYWRRYGWLARDPGRTWPSAVHSKP